MLKRKIVMMVISLMIIVTCLAYCWYQANQAMRIQLENAREFASDLNSHIACYRFAQSKYDSHEMYEQAKVITAIDKHTKNWPQYFYWKQKRDSLENVIRWQGY